MESKMLGGENTVFYKKLFTLVLPIAFQQFMVGGGSSFRCAHAWLCQSGCAFGGITGRAGYLRVQPVYGGIDDGDEYPGCAVLW